MSSPPFARLATVVSRSIRDALASVWAPARPASDLDPAYREHVAQANQHRLVGTILLTIVFFPGFTFLDRVVFPALATRFLEIRLVGTAIIAGYCLLGLTWPKGWLAHSAVGVATAIIQAAIIVMVCATGGFESSYWVGLLFVNSASLGMSPYGGRIGLLFGGIVAAYVLSCWTFVGPPHSARSFVEPMFFMVSDSAMLATVAALNARRRRALFDAEQRIVEQNREVERARLEKAAAIEQVKAGRLTGYLLDSRYALLEVIGRGGAGEVYLADDITVGRRCTVKVLHSELVDHGSALQRFMREASIAAEVASRHVVHMYGSGRDARGHHYLVMEYVPGEDLEVFFRRRGGPISFEEYLPICAQVVEALTATHAANLVHRDLKPKNVLISTTDAGPFVKLIDFGISKMLQARDEGTTLTGQMVVLGSPGYMAPEQTLGLSAEVTGAADVFALGAMTYRALSGEPAFRGKSPVDVCMSVCFEAFVPMHSLLPDLHPDLDAVLGLAMAKHPVDRLQSPAEFLRLLCLARHGALEETLRDRAAELTRRLVMNKGYNDLPSALRRLSPETEVLGN